jgi:hemerythrin-like metal-binding protein
MHATRIAPGLSYVEIPEAELGLLCGCPENAVKLLMKAGLVRPVKRGGFRFETGPNAVLLSECPVQGGRFANAAEFPVLQMLYRQGMIVPDHPGNTGRRPMLVGLREQLEAQSRYIYLGNYGLAQVADLTAAGMGAEAASERERMKLRFAFGRIRPTEELLDLRVLDAHAVELRGGAFVRRLGPNRYSVIHGKDSVEVDLECGGSRLPLAYELPRASIPRADFAVVHLGEGDGWDKGRPTMGSIVVYRGEPYLVDAGPDLAAALDALGIAPTDLRGIFHTHIHDDHFIGLASLIRAPRRIPYYAVPWVRAGAAAKLAALAGIGEADFGRYFELHDLVEGEWNDIGGLEVKPLFSPHPVETSVLRFRAFGKTYAHWADLSSFAVLDSMVTDDKAAPGISRELARRVKADYLEGADLKKIDSGGGMIHGEAADFAADASGEILVSHTESAEEASRLASSLGPRFRVARFGEASILAPESPSSPRAGAGPSHPSAHALAALEASGLLGPGFPKAVAEALAMTASEVSAPAGARLGQLFPGSLLLLREGRARLLASGEALAVLGPGEAFGEEAIACPGACLFEALALEPLSLVLLPATEVELVPALLWGLCELHQRRLGSARGVFRFVWRPEYSVGLEAIDLEHRGIFDAIREMREAWLRSVELPALAASYASFRRELAAHYRHEEELMERASFPGLREHARIHERILAETAVLEARLASGEAEPELVFDSARNELLEHTLLVDRQYIGALK